MLSFVVFLSISARAGSASAVVVTGVDGDHDGDDRSPPMVVLNLKSWKCGIRIGNFIFIFFISNKISNPNLVRLRLRLG